MTLDDLLAFGPCRFGIGVVFAGKNRRVERRLAVESSRAHEPAVVIDVFLALVSRRFLRQANVAGFVAEAEPIVVSLHRAVGRARALRVNRSLTVAVKAKVQLARLRILRTGFLADVGEKFARMRLVIFVTSFASDAIRDFGQRGEVAFVSGVDISDAGYGDVVLRAVFAQREGFQCRPVTLDLRRVMREQRGDVRFGGDQLIEKMLSDAAFEQTHRIVLLRVARLLELRRIGAVGPAVVVLDALRVFVEEGRTRTAIERIPLHEAAGQHAADVPVVLHQQHGQPFTRSAN